MPETRSMTAPAVWQAGGGGAGMKLGQAVTQCSLVGGGANLEGAIKAQREKRKPRKSSTKLLPSMTCLTCLTPGAGGRWGGRGQRNLNCNRDIAECVVLPCDIDVIHIPQGTRRHATTFRSEWARPEPESAMRKSVNQKQLKLQKAVDAMAM